jgi:hypothetical protein
MKGVTMDKQPAGFVPANYKVAGNILLIVGIVSLLAKGVDYLTGWFSISNIPLYFGIVCILFSLYLIYYVAPREK